MVPFRTLRRTSAIAPRAPSAAGHAGTSPRSGFVRPAFLFAILIVAIRLVFACQVHFCGTPDACFYLATAKTLATEHRFHARFLFDLQLAHPTLPNTGLEYWRPGTSFFLLLARPFGISLFSSILVAILAGIVLAIAARHLARQLLPGGHPYRPWLPAAAFALCLIWPPLWDGSASPDSALFYGAAVAWFLALFTPRRQGLLQDALALLAVCAAYLIRNDAALLLVPLAAVLWRRHQLYRADRSESAGSPLAIALILLVFFVALAPMHLICRAVLGTAFPSGTAQALFLDDLSDFVRYHDPVSLHTLLAHGAGHLVKARIGTGFLIVYRVGALMLGYPALILLAGLRATRREPATEPSTATPLDLTGPIAFAVTLFLVYSLLLPAIGVFSALRSAVGLLPTAAVLTVLAIGRLSRTPRIAAGLLGATLAAYTVSGIMDDRRDIGPANEILARDLALAGGLRTLGADPATAVVMTPDPVQFSVTTGYAAIAAPDNGLDAIAAECRDLGATHVMLDTEHLPAPPEALQRALQPVRILRLDAEHALILQLARPR